MTGTAKEPRTTVVSGLVSASVHELLSQMAEERNTSVSEIVRDILMKRLEEQKVRAGVGV